MNGLAPHTSAIFEAVSRLNCIQPYLLVGGTALSLQINSRQSEDLDFMSWRTYKDEKREIDWPAISKELQTIGAINKCDILDMDHVEYVVEGVKISFYANPHRSPVQQEIPWLNNMRLADPVAIGAMKMELMLRRSKFRDYYDLYALLEAGYDFHKMVDVALKYSEHRLKSKNLFAMLTRSDRFVPDTSFKSLNPVYDVSPRDIEQRIVRELENFQFDA